MSKLLLIIVIIVSTFSVAFSADYLPFIVGGDDAEPAQFPYQVSIQIPLNISKYQHVCGGTILTKLWILTAAHCHTFDLEAYRVVAGITKLDEIEPNGQIRKVEKFLKHQHYIYEGHLNDIALIQLNESLQFNKFIQSIQLPTPGSQPTGKGVVTGWGAIDRVTLYYKFSKKVQFCTRAQFDGICYGDDGGALVQKGEIVGIVSFGARPCAAGVPTVLTKVSSFIDFIEINIENSNELKM